ncbi:MAG: adenylate kinase [Elusimicrobia bacterium]|nr:adenylate kinase [Elusimicrobiota bacterium]
MRAVLLGCPGAGKGTQSKILCERFGAAHIASGDLFRSEIEKQSPLGLKVQDYVQKGMLVPDGVVIELIASKLDASDAGWLLDGFPRTHDQAMALDKWLEQNGKGIDAVVYISMKEDEVVRRLTSRRTCGSCGAVYNLLTKPPREEGKCDACGAALVQRSDDTEATVRKRLMVFNDLTAPLISYYKHAHDFFEVDGGRDMAVVTEDLSKILGAAMAKGA